MDKTTETLINGWRAVKDDSEMMYPDDRAVIAEYRNSVVCKKNKEDFFCSFDSLKAYQSSDQYKNYEAQGKKSRCMHLGLIPEPYVGDIQNASVFLMMLNPSLSLDDYKYERGDAKFREVSINNLHQNFSNKDYPFFFLDPQFKETGGGSYWNKKFNALIQFLSSTYGKSCDEVRKVLAKNIALIELVPYHSQTYRVPSDLDDNLQSRKDMMNFAEANLYKNQSRTLVLLRHARIWNCPRTDDKVAAYFNPGLAAGAPLTPGSEGGRKISNALADKF